jgi:starch phosphorylase
MKHVGDADGAGGPGRAGGGERFEATVQLPHAGLTGYTVRVLPSNPLLASPVELGKVVLAR